MKLHEEFKLYEDMWEIDAKPMSLHERGAGGQRTYKQFLLYLARFLKCEIPANYKSNWVLHHRDCDHDNNEDFTNLVLMDASHHISFHKQLPEHATIDDMNKLLENGTMKDGTKFAYWPIGEAIHAQINKVVTEPSIEEITR